MVNFLVIKSKKTKLVKLRRSIKKDVQKQAQPLIIDLTEDIESLEELSIKDIESFEELSIKRAIKDNQNFVVKREFQVITDQEYETMLIANSNDLSINNDNCDSIINFDEEFYNEELDEEYVNTNDDYTVDDPILLQDDVHTLYVTMNLSDINLEVSKYMVLLNEYGLKNHFKSSAGGKIQDKKIKAINRGLCSCVHWIYNLHQPPVVRLSYNSGEFNEYTFMKYVRLFITRDYSLLSSYSEYCEQYNQLKSTTMKGLISDIYSGIKWFILFKNTTEFTVKQNQIFGIDQVVSGLRRCLSKEMKKNKPDASLSQVTYDMKLPEASSGVEQLQILQRHIIEQTESMNSIINKVLNDNLLVKSEYILFMRILYSSLYLFTAQGRIGGVESLLYKDGNQLLTDNYTLTSKFKTEATFGKQPILLGDVSKDLFSLYFNHLRPFIVQQSQIEENWHEAPMWLTFNGLMQKNIGQQMSKYFLKAMNLNVTTNLIRSLVETLCDGLHR
jgi:hypothetical protein